RRLILCSGKVYYDLVLAPARAAADQVAIGRVELMYPFPGEELAALVRGYPNLKEIVWVQEEPRNMGPQKFMLPQLRELVPPAIMLRAIARPERSSPAEGYPAAHQVEQARIVTEALAVVGDTLYAVGGLAERTFVPVNTLWLYREDRNGWEPRAALPAPRGASAVGVVNGELIVVGGWGAGRRLMAASAIYDPAKDRWRDA